MVTSPNESRNSKPFSPFVLDFTNAKFHLTVLILKVVQVIVGSRDLRLLTHRFPTHTMGRVGLFTCFIRLEETKWANRSFQGEHDDFITKE